MGQLKVKKNLMISSEANSISLLKKEYLHSKKQYLSQSDIISDYVTAGFCLEKKNGVFEDYVLLKQGRQEVFILSFYYRKLLIKYLLKGRRVHTALDIKRIETLGEEYYKRCIDNNRDVFKGLLAAPEYAIVVELFGEELFNEMWQRVVVLLKADNEKIIAPMIQKIVKLYLNIWDIADRIEENEQLQESGVKEKYKERFKKDLQGGRCTFLGLGEEDWGLVSFIQEYIDLVFDGLWDRVIIEIKNEEPRPIEDVFMTFMDEVGEELLE